MKTGMLCLCILNIGIWVWISLNTIVCKPGTSANLRDAKTMIFTGDAALRGPQAATLKDDDLIPRWPSTASINVVVVGGQTNPYR